METLETSRVCRLCGKHAGMAIDVFDKRGNHVKKINAVLPILVHQMDMLPKHICHPCNYKLQQFHKFYEDCLKTDANLKGQLSWMRGSVEREEKGPPMVQINKLLIKTELPDYDELTNEEAILYDGNLTNYLRKSCDAYANGLPSYATRCSKCGCHCGFVNRTDDKMAKNAAMKRGIKRDDEIITSNDEFTPRDVIRRNLFATEIFGDDNTSMQTGIAACDVIPSTIYRRSQAKTSGARSRNVERRQNGRTMAVKREMADDQDDNDATANARTLRSKKNRVDVAATTLDKDGATTNVYERVKVKVEPRDDVERNLRPRNETIDYRDKKHTKNPLARTCVSKTSPKENSATKVNRKMDDSVRIKVEPDEVVESLRYAKTNGKTRNFGTSRMDGKERTDKNLKTGKMAESGRRRKVTAKREIQGSPYLRSQRVQLRNGKMKNFDSVVDKPMKIQNSNFANGIPLVSIKREKLDVDSRTMQNNAKYRNCDNCKCRFLNLEVYMLHHCNTNRRHS